MAIIQKFCWLACPGHIRSTVPARRAGSIHPGSILWPSQSNGGASASNWRWLCSRCRTWDEIRRQHPNRLIHVQVAMAMSGYGAAQTFFSASALNFRFTRFGVCWPVSNCFTVSSSHLEWIITIKRRKKKSKPTTKTNQRNKKETIIKTGSSAADAARHLPAANDTDSKSIPTRPDPVQTSITNSASLNRSLKQNYVKQISSALTTLQWRETWRTPSVINDNE